MLILIFSVVITREDKKIFDALIQFIHDAKTNGGIIDLPINTPISFSGDMNLVGYSDNIIRL